MKYLLPAILAIASLAATAAEPVEEFAFAVPIEGLGSDALYRVTIPQSAYESAAFADLRDLRIFNGGGESVPYAFRSVERVVQRPAPIDLAFFALRGPGDVRADQLDLSFDKAGGKVSVRLDTRGAKTAQQVLLGYLIDASALKTPLAGVEFDWNAPQIEQLAPARLEAGDDLKHWTTLATDVPLGALSHAGQRLERKAIEYASHRAKYLRLIWTDASRAIELKAVRGLSPEQTAQQERAWKEIVATPDAGKPGDYLVDTGGRYPLDRLALRLPQENTVAPVQLFSRDKPGDKWIPVTRAVVYRLRQGGAELVSPDVAIAANTHRYWLFRVDPAAGGIGSGPLGVRLGWTPREIVFAARGNGPFRLAYGNAKASASALSIETLVPGWRTDQEPKMPAASTGAAQTLAGEGAARQRTDLKKWGLWAALLAAVALLAWMAWKLSVQMQKPGGQ